jgi:holo-[acyl-carrier protein] synthase
MNDIGIGVDVESVERFAKLDRERDKGFFNKIYTDDELDYCFSKTPAAPRLAARYAAKEAVVKALGNLGITAPSYQEIEIARAESGAPVVRLGQPGLAAKVSLSHTEDTAIAFAIVSKL